MSGDQRRTYIHYSDKKGYQGIRNEGVIHASRDTYNDAVYGEGAYATKMDPTKNKGSRIAQNNYDGAAAFYEGKKKEGKVDYAVRYTDPVSSHQRVDPRITYGRDVHMYPGDLYLGDMENVQYFRRDKSDNYKPIRK